MHFRIFILCLTLIGLLSACGADTYTVTIGTPPTIPDAYYEHQEQSEVEDVPSEVCVILGKTEVFGTDNVSLISIEEPLARISINGMVNKTITRGDSICSGFQLTSLNANRICATRIVRQ